MSRIERVFLRSIMVGLLGLVITGAAWGPTKLAQLVLGSGLPQAGEVVPRQIPYRGYIEQNGIPLTSVGVPMRFRLYGLDGGVLHEETQAAVVVNQGHFSVELGDGTLFGADVMQQNFLELEVAIGAPPVTLLGRQRLFSVPFSQQAWRASSADSARFATGASYAADAGFAQVAARAGRSDRHIVTYLGKSYSLGSLACGTQGPSTTGAISSSGRSGVSATKLICETACGSPSAHMCTAEDVFLMKSLEYPLPAGIHWVTGNFRASYPGTYGWTDCQGWTNSEAPGAPGFFGSTIENGGLNVDGCNSSHPVLCCD